MPLTATDRLTDILKKVESFIPKIEEDQNYKIDEEIKKKISNVKEDLNKEFQKIKQKSNPTASKVLEPKPLENFRSLSVIPTMTDLFVDKPFLRPCKINEPYDDVEHYLDVQFRLMKDDFTRPLRNGIKDYLEKAQKRNHDLRVYKNVRLINFEKKELDQGIQLSFGNLKFVDWQRSKRLMYGGLLLLSKDNFKTIIFATVANRDIDNLLRGIITIEPCDGTVIPPNLYNCNLVLLESKIYFEPYFAVLTAMQKINADNFPMERYFIQCEKQMNLPQYLEDEKYLKFKNKFVLPLKNDEKTWPSAKELKLDESQLEAFKNALTQDLAIIQGPPGTGKTFIALQIVRCLLENKSKWRKYGPIVVVCLTNHALDQFLEGITDYTESIVRLGNRSNSEILEQFTLAKRRKYFQYYDANERLNDIRRQQNNVIKTVKFLQNILESFYCSNYILSLNTFKECDNKYVMKRFKCTNELISWLTGLELSFISNDPAVNYPNFFHIVNYLNIEIEFVKNELNNLQQDFLPFNLIYELEDYLEHLLKTKAYVQVSIYLYNKVIFACQLKKKKI